ncbi:hypothetical protein BV25DRAFT_1902845 [Artomyces pyxidatus]|uniref:Uncharacterized protein n=1 Tax=Artomyces pyxidatus TaxID=48021 RepID=A0ACB8SLU3_9AGAM|nr:hypothetical protein BV25DRAFT_1902845 [Artomyces pyxidatus]
MSPTLELPVNDASNVEQTSPIFVALRTTFLFASRLRPVNDIPKRSTADILDMDFACRGLNPWESFGDVGGSDPTPSRVDENHPSASSPSHLEAMDYSTTIPPVSNTMQTATLAQRSLSADQPRAVEIPAIIISLPSCDPDMLSTRRTLPSRIHDSDGVGKGKNAEINSAKTRRKPKRVRARILARTRSLPVFPSTNAALSSQSMPNPRTPPVPLPFAATVPIHGHGAAVAITTSDTFSPSAKPSVHFEIDEKTRAALGSRKRSTAKRCISAMTSGSRWF